MSRGNLASSNLRSYDYDEDTQTLTITFLSGRSYRYLDVPPGVVEGLASAGSPGRYFNAAIKDQFAEA